ncbi:MAG: calcium-binding protein, partial [Pseudomonadota bacterium]
GDDAFHGENGNDWIAGGLGNDLIHGGLGNDRIFGGGNFDTIDAGDGHDVVDGGDGRDVIDLGAGDDRYVDTPQGDAFGSDTITGGAGADTFVFHAEMADDVITDFVIGQDGLELSAALLGGRTAAQVVDLAQVTPDGVWLDFGGGESLLLQGLTGKAGLDDAILIF